ncbi:MAG TPA: VOC family protein [Albitalea sp.]|uniref:VOC family protein n=1 Tax=Piscinibacter sp. TaxID=1903157 RepID=UPI002ED4F0D5
MAPQIERIDHIHLYVADRGAAQRWYDEVLGFRVVPELAHWAEGGGPLTLADASGGVHLALFERPPKANRATIAFGVANAQFAAWQAHLREHGMAAEKEDHGVAWSLYFSDPDGNPYEITTYL